MKIGRVLFLVLLSFCLAGTAGFAEEKNAPPISAGSPASKLDTDNDGKLSPEEVTAGRGAWQQGRINGLSNDLSGDGQIDETDRQILRDQFTRSNTEAFSSTDPNGDGALDSAEISALLEKSKVEAAQWKTTADTDKNGVVDANEEKAAMDAWQKERS